MAWRKEAVRTTVVSTLKRLLDQPERLLTFHELEPFTKRWHSLGLHDIDLLELQLSLLSNPKQAPAITGTGGLRKMRWAGFGRSKRDSFRVCYVHYEEFGTILLVIIYPKNEFDDLSEQFKKSIRQVIESIRTKLASRPYRWRTINLEKP